MKQIDDNILIKQTIDGDVKSFEEIVKRYKTMVYALSFRVLKNREEAEDIAQDVFLKIYQSLKSFSMKSKLSTWIYRITYNTSINRFKSKKRIVETIEIDKYAEFNISSLPDAHHELSEKEKQAIIKSAENTRTFETKNIKTKEGKNFSKMYSLNKFVSHYYIYIDDEKLGLCYLKIASYIPFVSEFYFNGHNYLKKQLDLAGKKYTMNDNSFTKVEDLEMLNNLTKSFQPSIALGRINHWMDIFFKFDQGQKSTRSKLLHHNWFTYQTEIATNLILKSAKFATAYFDRILSKHHTIGLPDKLTEIFSLSRQKNNGKTTQNKFKTKAVIKHWLEGNSIKCYNKSGCLIRVETTINKPDLPGLKLKKPAINLMAYYWYGLGSNSRYIETISDIDISTLDDEVYRKYQDTITNANGVKIAYSPCEMQSNFYFPKIISRGKLRKLRERGAVKKIQSSHYYQLTKEGYIWIFYSFFNSKHMVKPLMSGSYKNSGSSTTDQASIIEGAYTNINKAVSLIMKEFKLVS